MGNTTNNNSCVVQTTRYTYENRRAEKNKHPAHDLILSGSRGSSSSREKEKQNMESLAGLNLRKTQINVYACRRLFRALNVTNSDL